MRNIFRLAAASALSLPILLGFAGLASADPHAGYVEQNVAAGSYGAYSESTEAYADSNDAYYQHTLVYAGPWGSGVIETTSWAHWDEDCHCYDHDHDNDLEAGYAEEEVHAGDWGASSSESVSYAESD